MVAQDEATQYQNYKKHQHEQRNTERERVEDPAERAKHAARAKKGPNQAFIDYYRAQLQLPEEEFDAFLASLVRPLPVTFRLVLLGIDGATTTHYLNNFSDRLAAFGVSAQQLWGSSFPGSNGWQLPMPKAELRAEQWKPLQAFLLAETAAGRMSRQEAVSQLPAMALNAQPGELVLDMCAAPGSKTTQLLEMVGATGGVLANDPDLKRARMMIHRINAVDTTALLVTNCLGQLLPQMQQAGEEQLFDKVLCDVPCSSDGTLRKAAHIGRKWHVNQAHELHLLQARLVRHALALVKVGGLVVYSTCSLNPLENEAVVSATCQLGNVEIVDLSETPLAGQLQFMPGLCSWKVPDKNIKGKLYDSYEEVPCKPGRGKPGSRRGLFPSMFPDTSGVPLERCARVLPHLQDTGAFFVALLRKTGPIAAEEAREGEEAPAPPRLARVPAPAPVQAAPAEEPTTTRAPVVHTMEAFDPSVAWIHNRLDALERSRPLAPNVSSTLPAVHMPVLDEINARLDALQSLSIHNQTHSATGPITAEDSEPLVGEELEEIEEEDNFLGEFDLLVPLSDVPEAAQTWKEICEFYKITSDFPAEQLLVRKHRLARMVLVSEKLVQLLALPGACEGFRVVSAGQTVVQRMTGSVQSCDTTYRLSTASLRSMLPCMHHPDGDDRVFILQHEAMVALLREGWMDLSADFERTTTGCCVCVLRDERASAGYDPSCAVVVWRGRNSVKLWISREQATAMLAILTEQNFDTQ